MPYSDVFEKAISTIQRIWRLYRYTSLKISYLNVHMDCETSYLKGR